jgi:hypothetical protein
VRYSKTPRKCGFACRRTTIYGRRAVAWHRLNAFKSFGQPNFDDGPPGYSPLFALKIDPGLMLYSGEQHGEDDNNFRVFLDSCTDRWGRLFKVEVLDGRIGILIFGCLLVANETNIAMSVYSALLQP